MALKLREAEVEAGEFSNPTSKTQELKRGFQAGGGAGDEGRG